MSFTQRAAEWSYPSACSDRARHQFSPTPPDSTQKRAQADHQLRGFASFLRVLSDAVARIRRGSWIRRCPASRSWQLHLLFNACSLNASKSWRRSSGRVVLDPFESISGHRRIPNREESLCGGPAPPIAVHLCLLFLMAGEFADGLVHARLEASYPFYWENSTAG